MLSIRAIHGILMFGLDLWPLSWVMDSIYAFLWWEQMNKKKKITLNRTYQIKPRICNKYDQNYAVLLLY